MYYFPDLDPCIGANNNPVSLTGEWRNVEAGKPGIRIEARQLSDGCASITVHYRDASFPMRREHGEYHATAPDAPVARLHGAGNTVVVHSPTQTTETFVRTLA